MPILPTLLTYTDKDEAAFRSRLQKLIKSAFPNWTDFAIANFGNVLVELYAHVGGVLTFYQDAQAGESRWTTAQLRRSLLALVKLIGYKPATATASQVSVVITLTSGIPVGDVLFPKGTIVQTATITAPVRFELIQDYTINGGSDPPEIVVVAKNSFSRTDSFTSSGLPNQSLKLSATPFLSEDLEVTAANGIYTEVDSFFGSTPTDRHFTVDVDQNAKAKLTFGNGTTGAVPQGAIDVKYKIGGGAIGNVDANTIVKISGTFSDAFNTQVSVSVNNPAAATAGVDIESNEAIRANAPAAIRVINRTVAREDYEINAERVPGVARALMTTSNEDGAIAENTGKLYVVPIGGGVPDQSLLDDVLEIVTITFPNTITFVVFVVPPIYAVVDIFARVFLQPGAVPSTTGTAIRDAIDTFFAITDVNGEKNTAINFGLNYRAADGSPASEIPMSDIMNVVRDITGVRKIGPGSSDFTLSGTHQDFPLQINEFPLLGSVTIINGDTGLEI